MKFTKQQIFKSIVVSIICLFLLTGHDAFAKVGYVAKMEPMCRDKSGMGDCSGVDCVGFCEGKSGLTCKGNVLVGGNLFQVICCGCDYIPTPSAKTCVRPSDCGPNQECVVVKSPDASKVNVPGRLQPKPTTVQKRCAPKLTKCAPGASCPQGYICYQQKCVPY
jgi:hypothetical protein